MPPDRYRQQLYWLYYQLGKRCCPSGYTCAKSNWRVYAAQQCNTILRIRSVSKEVKNLKTVCACQEQ
jgi:hypothetical protein